MTFSRSLTVSLVASAPLLAAGPALAGDITVTFEIPRLDVAEYHRPYVALWVEGEGRSHVFDIAVLYDTKLPDKEGNKWLKDMRQWWRRSGRELDMPVDGISRPTLPPGRHDISVTDSEGPLAALAPGDYNLVIEAAREVGGRELLRVPFTWPASADLEATETGSSELGTVTLTFKP